MADRLGRNPHLAHGVASDDVLDAKAAAIGVLLLQQLAYLLLGEDVAETPPHGDAGN